MIELSNRKGQGRIAFQQGDRERPQIWHNFFRLLFDAEVFEHSIMK
jgi:hypothetical protein